MLKLNKIYCGDCLKGMKFIDDKSIDMILCDLPYGITACKWDTIIPLKPLWIQYKRVIKDNSAIVLFASQPFTSILVTSNIKMFKYEWIWEKEQGTGQLNAKIMPLKSHENILVFGIGKIKYNAQKKLVNKSYNKKVNSIMEIIKYDASLYNSGVPLRGYNKKNVLDRWPKSIIKVNRELKGRVHLTQKPVTLCEYLIKTYTDIGGLVLDNCIGSGTTAIAAINTKRNYIGIELDRKYVNIANERIRDYKRKEVIVL